LKPVECVSHATVSDFVMTYITPPSNMHIGARHLKQGVGDKYMLTGTDRVKVTKGMIDRFKKNRDTIHMPKEILGQDIFMNYSVWEKTGIFTVEEVFISEGILLRTKLNTSPERESKGVIEACIQSLWMDREWHYHTILSQLAHMSKRNFVLKGRLNNSRDIIDIARKYRFVIISVRGSITRVFNLINVYFEHTFVHRTKERKDVIVGLNPRGDALEASYTKVLYPYFEIKVISIPYGTREIKVPYNARPTTDGADIFINQVVHEREGRIFFSSGTSWVTETLSRASEYDLRCSENRYGVRRESEQSGPEILFGECEGKADSVTYVRRVFRDVGIENPPNVIIGYYSPFTIAEQIKLARQYHRRSSQKTITFRRRISARLRIINCIRSVIAHRRFMKRRENGRDVNLTT
jgi:hypothetical protein